MKKRNPAGAAGVHWTRSHTGSHCPKTGWWVPSGQVGAEPQFLTEGSIMPTHNGIRVSWETDRIQVPNRQRYELCVPGAYLDLL